MPGYFIIYTIFSFICITLYFPLMFNLLIQFGCRLLFLILSRPDKSPGKTMSVGILCYLIYAIYITDTSIKIRNSFILIFVNHYIRLTTPKDFLQLLHICQSVYSLYTASDILYIIRRIDLIYHSTQSGQILLPKTVSVVTSFVQPKIIIFIASDIIKSYGLN